MNDALILTTIRLRKINESITKYERKKIQKELEYKHKYRTTFLEIEGKSESQKKMLAELACSKEEVAIMYLDEVVKELTREAYTIKTELDTLKTLGHNMRQEMKIY